MNWLIKNEKIIFYVLMILSLIFGIIGIETKAHWMFYVGFGLVVLQMVIGPILRKIFKK